jgi:MFS transporter, MHS family, proline/betaine transporter
MRGPMKRTLGAASIGNFREIYDFAVFGFSVPFIAAHFFPGTDASAALLSTFAVYAVAFFARPIGGLLFGYLLDRIGRSKVLAITFWLMAGGTALIGVLPTYETIGIAAPLLLIACRLAQGVAMGGETTGSSTFILESSPPSQRGLWVGTIFFFANVPNSFVALMLLALQLIVGLDAYLDWAWRIPFLLGGLIGVIGFWLRRNLEDPEEYKQAAKKFENHNPLRAVMRSGIKSMLFVVMILPLQSVASYLLLGYMYTFMVMQAGFDSASALVCNAVAIAAYAISIPIGGALSDKFGRKAVLTLGALWVAVVAHQSILFVANGTFAEAVFGQIVLAIGIGLYGSACFVAAAELFSTSFRGTGHAISYQLTVAVFGGTAPFVSAWLVNSLGTPLALGWYVTIIAVINLILVQFVPETKDVTLRDSIQGTSPKVSSGRRVENQKLITDQKRAPRDEDLIIPPFL